MLSDIQPDHTKITAAGWAYRGDRQHWLIYKNPDTARWHTRAEAVRIIEARMGLSKAASDETLASQDGLG